MGMSQACSPNIGLMAGAPPIGVKVPRGRVGRNDLPDPTPPNSNRTASPGDRGTEWVLVQQAIAGNPDAQERLFARHTRRLYRIALALLNNKEDAEDALQEGFCKAFTSLCSFQGRSSFSTWLTRIVINSALMARRRKSAHPGASLDEMLEYQPKQMPRGFVDQRPDPEKLYAETELNARVEKHVSLLPTTLQAAFQLYAINGVAGPESSKALGISPSAFKSRIFRARLKLACGLYRSLEVSAIAHVLRKRC